MIFDFLIGQLQTFRSSLNGGISSSQPSKELKGRQEKVDGHLKSTIISFIASPRFDTLLEALYFIWSCESWLLVSAKGSEAWYHHGGHRSQGAGLRMELLGLSAKTNHKTILINPQNLPLTSEGLDSLSTIFDVFVFDCLEFWRLSVVCFLENVISSIIILHLIRPLKTVKRFHLCHISNPLIRGTSCFVTSFMPACLSPSSSNLIIQPKK